MSRPGRGGHSAETRASVLKAMRDTGLPIRDIAEVYEVSTGTVCKWAKEAGVGRRRGVASVPACHPDRPFYSKGLCRNCYQREWARPVTLTRGPYQPKVAA